ncbi:MAG TPA: ferrochelatase [Terriglobia bacterium]|nr:ferrochelatase [Terriglobia bacterium]
MKTGVLLFNLGGPETLDDVKPFLYQLFSDPEIIRIQWTPLRKAVAYTIATLRKRKSQGYYAQIGGGSPLRRLTEEQARALQGELERRRRGTQVFVGMCAWRPFLAEAMSEIAARGIQRLVILPLFPQYSVTTTGGGFAVLNRIIERKKEFSDIDVTWVRSWQHDPGYISAFAGSIAAELAKFPDPEQVHLLFSAHSIPESYVREGDPYLDQTRQTMEAIMDALGRRNSYQLSFQSKIGPVKWLEPATNDVILELGQKKTPATLIVPISFVSEHIETLYELDILYKKVAKDAGLVDLRRVPTLNSDPAFIAALADIVERALS